MASRLLLSNDSTLGVGYHFDDRYVSFNPLANETSVHGNSAAVVQVFTVPAGASGTIVDFQIGVVTAAISASGWVSGTVDVTPRINSFAVMSTVPAILMAGSTGQAGRVFTGVSSVLNQALCTSGIVNAASNAFSADDQISYDYNARSVGSAAAGTSGKGLYAVLVARYNAT